MNYENRIVAFIDILGFKDLLDKTVDKDENDVEGYIDSINDAYRVIRNAWDLDAEISKPTVLSKLVEKENKKKKKVVTIFSDTIVVSFLQNAPSEIFFTLIEIKWMIMNLVNRGILCRGALSFGKLIHTDKNIFGPALVEAYITESKAALYPRIIISRELIQLAGKYTANHHSPEEEVEYVNDLLKKDGDGMYYIDYFLGAQSELDDPEYDFPEYLSKMGDFVRKGLRSRRPDVKIKYMWMREKINEVIELGKKRETQEQLKKVGNHDIAEVWKKMKKV